MKFQSPNQLTDRRQWVAKMIIRRSKRVSDVRLDLRLFPKDFGDLRLGGVDRFADGDGRAATPLLADGSSRGEDGVFEETQYGLGPFAARSDSTRAASVADFALRDSSRAASVASFALVVALFAFFSSRLAQACTPPSAERPTTAATSATPAEAITVRFRRAHRRARRPNGSRQAVTVPRPSNARDLRRSPAVKRSGLQGDAASP